MYDTISWAWRLRGPLDVLALRRALTEIMRRHESLRSSFCVARGEVVQVIHFSPPLPLFEVDLTSIAPAKRARALTRLATEDVEQPFQLATAPLFHATLVQLGVEEHVLLWRLSHAIWDAACPSLLVREVAFLYRSMVTSRSSSLVDLPVQLGDHAAWEKRYDNPEARAHWRRELASFSSTIKLPVNRDGLRDAGFIAAHRDFDGVSGVVTRNLRLLAHQHGTTLSSVLLASFAAVISWYASQNEFVFGVIDQNRDRPESRSIIGCLASLLLLRVDVSGDPSFRELIARLRNALFGAYSHKIPLEQQLPDGWTRPTVPSRPPICEVKFNFHPVEMSDHEGDMCLKDLGMKLDPYIPAVKRRTWRTDTAWFGAYLGFAVRTKKDDCISGFVEYSRSAMDANAVDALTSAFTRLLMSVVLDPERRLGELRLLCAREW